SPATKIETKGFTNDLVATSTIGSTGGSAVTVSHHGRTYRFEQSPTRINNEESLAVTANVLSAVATASCEILERERRAALLWRLPALESKLMTRSATRQFVERKTAFDDSCDLLYSRRGLLNQDQYDALQRQLESLLTEDGEPIRASVASVESLDSLISFLA